MAFKTPLKSKMLMGAAALAALAAAATPALAQPATVGELTVTGRYGVGPDVRSLSTAVSYADLDLTTAAGRDILTHRVRDAARDLCGRLGERNITEPPVVRSCEQDALDSAREAERIAFATAAPQAYAVVPSDQPYVAPAGPNAMDEPPAAAAAYGQAASATVTTETVTNGPVADTAATRRAYGGPMSNGGRRTTPAGN
jgi:UrcA family protein